MKKIDAEDVVCERLKRQGLLDPLDDIQDEESYLQLFKRLQPVAPMHHVRPGDPPKLVHRTSYNDSQLSDRLRKKHEIVKGRFLGGRVGYVTQEDLHLYATVFKKPLTKVKPVHEEILEAIRSAGGISKDQLKEELPFPAGAISKELPRLQEAFLVYHYNGEPEMQESH